METYKVGEHSLYKDTPDIRMVDYRTCHQCHEIITVENESAECVLAGYYVGKTFVYCPYLPLFIC